MFCILHGSFIHEGGTCEKERYMKHRHDRHGSLNTGKLLIIFLFMALLVLASVLIPMLVH
jgi:hypothetical protein